MSADVCEQGINTIEKKCSGTLQGSMHTGRLKPSATSYPPVKKSAQRESYAGEGVEGLGRRARVLPKTASEMRIAIPLTTSASPWIPPM